MTTRTAGLRRLVTIGASAALLAGAVLGASPATADPGLDAAAQANALSLKIERLQVKAEVATEKYNGVNTQLSGVVTRMLLASERLDALNRISGDSRANATRRISAIYKAGGGLTLYASVLDGSSPDDMVTRIRTVQSLVDDDYEASSAIESQVAEAESTKAKMKSLAAERTELERVAREAKDKIDALVRETQDALDSANETIRTLAEQATQNRTAAAEGQAASALGTITVSGPGNPYAIKAISFAASKIGLPYVWGGNGPNGYDCSGLMQQAYKAAGLSILRVAADQYRAGPEVALNAIAPGDLVFWATNPARKSTIHHVAMYVGDGKMIEAPHTGAFVRLVPLRLGAEFAGAVRPGLPASAR